MRLLNLILPLLPKISRINLPNEKQFLEGDSISSAKSWDIEPVFKRSADMCELWELEQVSKNKVLKAHKIDKRKFG